MALTLERPSVAHARATTTTVRIATTGDHGALTALLTGCSPATLGRRFLTGMAGPPSARVVSYLLRTVGPGGAHLAFRGSDPIGHAMWVPVGKRTAEIALLVRDDEQGRGVGSELLRAVGDGMRAAGLGWAQITTAADNRVVTAMVRRRSPQVRPERDGADLTYLVPVDGAAGAT